jgi:alkylation response protein AidB-like acyl-CoA dehydrogenase
MQAACDQVYPYVHYRKQFDKPIGQFQLIQGKLADMYCKLSASRSYVYTIARACDNGVVSNKDCAVRSLLVLCRCRIQSTKTVFCRESSYILQKEQPRLD